MVKVSILYPNTAGSTFDFAYYTQTHMPRAIELLGSKPGYRGVSVERGLTGAAPGSAPEYAAMCHFAFDSVALFLDAFLPHAQELQGDIPNYTDVQAIIQINEVLISHP